MTTFKPYRGFRIGVDKHGSFVAEVGTETCRAESMDGIRRSIDAEMHIRAEDPVSIPVVTFGGGHFSPAGRYPEIINWHSVDYNVHSFKGSDPNTGEKILGYDRVVRADTEIGAQVIELKRRLRAAHDAYRKLEDEFESLEDQHGLRPPGSLGTTWDFDRLAAQGWMVAHLNDTPVRGRP